MTKASNTGLCGAIEMTSLYFLHASSCCKVFIAITSLFGWWIYDIKYTPINVLANIQAVI
jgi:hypothetical protein